MRVQVSLTAPIFVAFLPLILLFAIKLITNINNSNKILEFLKNTNILEAGINNNKLHIRGSKDIYSGEIVNFGNGKQVMEEIGISESAIRYDYEPVMLSKLNSMLGSIKALPINEYIVMFDNVSKDILVTKPV